MDNIPENQPNLSVPEDISSTNCTNEKKTEENAGESDMTAKAQGNIENTDVENHPSCEKPQIPHVTDLLKDNTDDQNLDEQSNDLCEHKVTEDVKENCEGEKDNILKLLVEDEASALDNEKENSEQNSVLNANLTPKEEWEKREAALLEKIADLEKEQGENSVKGLKLQLKVKSEQNEILKAKLINLQTELSAVMKKPNNKNKDIVSKIKKQHEDLLTKAKGMIFDKMKVIKNQELQIEALTAQVSSLKEVASITKNLLEIRNLESQHLQERLEMMDMKIKAEKERHNLMAKKIETGTRLNEELKKEYETQLALFKELKERYEEKFRKLEQREAQNNEQREAQSSQQ